MKRMTNLEQALTSILASIEEAKSAGNSLVLAGLLQRKDTICAALAAPEHSWHVPQTQAPNNVRRQCERGEKVLLPLLASSGV
jgi:hypothetical protein